MHHGLIGEISGEECEGDGDMVKMSVYVPLVLLLGSTVMFGQTTWGGLRFGSSLGEVQKSLAAEHMTLQKFDTAWVVQPVWEIKEPTPGAPVIFHFAPNLVFSDGTLTNVTLVYSDAEPTVQYDATTWIYNQLVLKYGATATERGQCKPSRDDFGPSVVFGQASPTVDCSAMWKDKSQTVALDWYERGSEVGFGKLTLAITYKPIANTSL